MTISLFCHKVPLTGKGVMYPRLRDFLVQCCKLTWQGASFWDLRPVRVLCPCNEGCGPQKGRGSLQLRNLDTHGLFSFHKVSRYQSRHKLFFLTNKIVPVVQVSNFHPEYLWSNTFKTQDQDFHTLVSGIELLQGIGRKDS